MTDQLMPCPFCGTTPRLEDSDARDAKTGDRVGYTFVKCPECGTDKGAIGINSKERALTEWNRRPPVTAPAKGEDEARLREIAKLWTAIERAMAILGKTASDRWSTENQASDVLRAALSQQQPAGGECDYCHGDGKITRECPKCGRYQAAPHADAGGKARELELTRAIGDIRWVHHHIKSIDPGIREVLTRAIGRIEAALASAAPRGGEGT